MPNIALEAAEGRRWRHSLAASSGFLLAVFALASAAQSTLLNLAGEAIIRIDIGARLVANLSAVLVILSAAWSLPIDRLRWPGRLAGLLGICLLGAAVRAGVQLAWGVHSIEYPALVLADVLGAAVTTAVSIVAGLLFAQHQHRLRWQERQLAQRSQQAAEALRALRDEEHRVRADLAEGLHGSVQHGLLLASLRLDLVRDELVAAGAAAEPLLQLTALRDELDRMRQDDVRQLSLLLEPIGADLGMVDAARLLLERIPPTIERELELGGALRRSEPGAAGAMDIPEATRIVALRVLEEGVTNALRHGRARRIRLGLATERLRGRGEQLLISVEDDGSGAAEPTGGGEQHTVRSADGSGLRRLDERIRAAGGRLEFGQGSIGGARLHAVLPFSRR